MDSTEGEDNEEENIDFWKEKSGKLEEKIEDLEAQLNIFSESAMNFVTDLDEDEASRIKTNREERVPAALKYGTRKVQELQDRVKHLEALNLGARAGMGQIGVGGDGGKRDHAGSSGARGSRKNGRKTSMFNVFGSKSTISPESPKKGPADSPSRKQRDTSVPGLDVGSDGFDGDMDDDDMQEERPKKSGCVIS